MNANSISPSLKDHSLFLIRVILIAIFLYHGLPKALNWGFAAEKFVEFGLPGFLGPITGIAEVVASIFLIVAFQNFWTNLVLVGIITGAIVTVQLPGAIEKVEFTAGLERDLLILVICLVSAAFGPGSFALLSNKQPRSSGLPKSSV